MPKQITPLKKQVVSVRLSDEAHQLLRLLAEASGVSSGVQMELMIRKEAKREGISLPDTESQAKK